jgi:putative PIG3 family NAD(P)H quinone oxidoreductase
MRAVEIAHPGGPDVLRLVQRAVPQAGPGEALIRVAAAGVNRPDMMQRLGKYPPPPGASDVPGLEIAGTVVSGAGRWKEGDAVCALVAGGGYAEYCAVPVEQILPVPAPLSFTEAAAVPETFFTVWTNLFDRGRLIAGERVLIHGGTSGIGTTAIQLAAANGARVFATAGSDDKCDACRTLGAARAINYRREDFVRVILDDTTDGVDVVLDIVGGDYLQRNIDCLRLNGRLIQIGLLGGAKAQLNLSAIMQRRLTLTGSTLRVRTPAEKGVIAAALEQHVWPLIESRRVRPIVNEIYPLERAADAHRSLEAGHVVGKVVLEVLPAQDQ